MTITLDPPTPELAEATPPPDPAFAQVCVCGRVRAFHAGRKHSGGAHAETDLAGQLHEACPRFRRDPVDRAREALLEDPNAAIRAWDRGRKRSHKTADARAEGEYGVGPSDLKSCRKQIEYRENPPEGYVPVPTSKAAANAGSLIDVAWKRARKRRYPWRLYDIKVTVPGLDRQGELDELDSLVGRVFDLKTCGDYVWDNVIANGPVEEDVDQVMLYAMGLEDAGYAILDVEVVYYHRDTGRAERFVRDYDRARAIRAAGRLFAVLDDLHAGRELPRDRQGPTLDPICARFCPAVAHCWNLAEVPKHRTPEGWLKARDDKGIEAALEEYDRARSAGDDKAKAAARVLLTGCDTGRYGEMTLAWTNPQPKEIPDHAGRITQLEMWISTAPELRCPVEELTYPVTTKTASVNIVVKRVRAATLEEEAREATAPTG